MFLPADYKYSLAQDCEEMRQVAVLLMRERTFQQWRNWSSFSPLSSKFRAIIVSVTLHDLNWHDLQK